MMGIKSILIIGSFVSGALENFYQHGFEKEGISVDKFNSFDRYIAYLRKRITNRVINKLSADFFYQKVNEELHSFLGKKRYDVILVFKGMELFSDTVQQLKAHAMLVANYNPDHPYIFYAPGSGNQHVVNSIAHYDVHFSYAKKIVQQLQNKFNKQAYCIPFGYDERVHIKRDAAGSSFAGRILFIGAYDEERADYLNRLQCDILDIYGEAKWSSRNILRPLVRRAYRNKSLYGDDYTEAIATALGIINLVRKQNMLEDSHNMRTFEVPGYGGLLVSQRTGEQTEYFKEDVEAVFFDTADELREKLTYLAAHPAVAEKIKQAAYNRSVLSGYSYHQRSKQLLGCLLNHF